MKKINYTIILYCILFLNLNHIFFKKSYARNRQSNYNNNVQKKKKFTKEEDEKLNSLVEEFGINNWKKISLYMNNRNTKQCRERYFNYLAPNIKNGDWTLEEDNILIKKYKEYGPRWNILKQFFQERSYINVKNRYRYILRRNTAKKKQKKVKNMNINLDKDSENFFNNFDLQDNIYFYFDYE